MGLSSRSDRKNKILIPLPSAGHIGINASRLVFNAGMIDD